MQSSSKRRAIVPYIPNLFDIDSIMARYRQSVAKPERITSETQRQFKGHLDADDYAEADRMLQVYPALLGLGPVFQETTWLHYGAVVNNLEVTRWALGKGLDIEKFNQADYTPLMEAVVRPDRAPIVDALLKAGANLGTASPIRGWNAMHLAALSDVSSSALELLIQYQADLGARDRHGRTPMLIAVDAQAVANVKVLLQSSIKLSMDERWGGRTLMELAEEKANNEDGCTILTMLKAWQAKQAIEQIASSKIGLLSL